MFLGLQSYKVSKTLVPELFILVLDFLPLSEIYLSVDAVKVTSTYLVSSSMLSFFVFRLIPFLFKDISIVAIA